MLKMKKQTAKKNKGFTLIELLVVVAIIAILALIALLAINPVEMARRSRDSRRLSDLGTVRRAIDLSLADGGALSGTPDAHYSKTSNSASLDPTDVTNLVGLKVGKYLSTLPQDPSYVSGDATTVQTTNGTCPDGTATVAKSGETGMVYRFKSDGSTYVLSSHLESTDNCGAPSGDGNDNALYEVGTQPTLRWL